MSARIKIAIVAWCVIEAALFAILVRLFGLFAVCAVEFATGLLGFWLLKRKGRAALIKLRSSFRGFGGAARSDLIGDGLSLLGAVSLTLPGFLSDVVAIALLVPAVRTRVASLIVTKTRDSRARRPTSHAAPVIDLDPAEWRGSDLRQR